MKMPGGKKKKALLALIALVIFVMGMATGYLAYYYQNDYHPVGPKVVYTPEQLLAEANKLRAEKGVAPLKLDPRLNQSAQCWADEMKRLNFYAHNYPNGGNSSGCVKDASGYACKKSGENIAEMRYDLTPFNTSNGWPTSKSHYEAEINPNFELTGFGYSEFNGFGHYVQHFCDLK